MMIPGRSCIHTQKAGESGFQIGKSAKPGHESGQCWSVFFRFVQNGDAGADEFDPKKHTLMKLSQPQLSLATPMAFAQEG